MTTVTLYAIKNTHNGKFISKTKVSLWNQTDDLTLLYLGHTEQAAKQNCKRLNNYCKKQREEAADPFNTGWKDTRHVNDNFVVVPVELTVV